MRDQPFKRYFPSEKKITKSNYKYPTYQHYYESRVSLMATSPNKHQQKPNQTNQLQDAFITPTKKPIQPSKTEVKKQNKTNLKTELQHLKNEVYRIMQKKQGILRSPILDRKTISQKQNEIQSGVADDTDNQSVSSDKIFGETTRKVELKKMTQNYDYSKYMELQNNLLKTELRNLKNKYLNKKKELTEKCDALEQKNHFLENALFKSELSLTEEIAAMKIALKQTQIIEKQQIVPTSDKDKQCIKVEQLYQTIAKLQKEIEELRKKPIYNTSLQQITTNLKDRYEKRISFLLEQKNSLLQQVEEKARLNRQLANQKQYLQTEVDMLRRRIQSETQRHSYVEEQYNKTMEIAQRNHEELIKTLHQEFNNKLLSLTPKKQSLHQSQQEKISKSSNNEGDLLRKEIKRWKIEYKILKQRYESYLRLQNESQSEIKDYYRGYQQYKQKNTILQQKNSLLQQQYSKCIKLLSSKDQELISKQTQLITVTDQLSTTNQKNDKLIIALKDRCQALEERLNQETLRSEKDIAYRQDLQQRLLNSQTGDQRLKQALQRTKKRLIEQDEKLSKNVKELKNKQSLISKLKQQLRELMENTDKIKQQKIIDQVHKLIEVHKNSEESALSCLRIQFEQQRVLMNEVQSKLIGQLQVLKTQKQEGKRKLADVQSQLKLISHSYNTKTIELTNVIANLQQQLLTLRQQMQEMQVTYESTITSLREEISMKSEEIVYLRKEVVSKYTISGSMNISGSFDEVLRSQIQGNNRLKEESLRKVQEIYKMRDNYSSLRSQYENIKSENQINKLKFLSEKNNIEVAYQAEIQNYKHSIANWEKKIISLQQKIKIFIEENKKKDQFIQQFIIAKRITENQKEVLSDFMRQYQISLGSKDIVDRLMVQAKVIQSLQKYNENLLKEVALLKEKLVLYQAIDGQRLSLYQSNLSAKSKKQAEQKIEFDGNESKLKKAISLQEVSNMENEN